MDEKIKELVNREDFMEKMLACEEPEQVQALFAAEGVELTIDDVKAIGATLDASISEGDELDEDSLDNVAGGSLLASVGVAIGVAVVEAIPWRRVGRAIKRGLKKIFRGW